MGWIGALPFTSYRRKIRKMISYVSEISVGRFRPKSQTKMPTKGRKACEMRICEIHKTVRQRPRLTGEHMCQRISAMGK